MGTLPYTQFFYCCQAKLQPLMGMEEENDKANEKQLMIMLFLGNKIK